MEQRSTDSVSHMGQHSTHGEHDRSTIAKKGNEILEIGKEKIQNIKKDLPENIQAKADDAMVWMRANPYKATSIGLLGLLSFKSKLARNIGMAIATTAGTMFLKDKFMGKTEENKMLH